MDATPPEALRMLSARLMTPMDWPGELGADWSAACAAAGLDPAGPRRRSGKPLGPGGYGLVLCEDADGSWWTIVTSDPRAIEGVAALGPYDEFSRLEPDLNRVIETRPGWLAYPEAGAVRSTDPAVVEESRWSLPSLATTAARRRSLADRVANEIWHLQARSFDDYLMGWREEEANMGITDPDPPPPRVIDMRVVVDADHPGAIPEALAALVALAQNDPPAGAFRSQPANSGNEQLLRATGDTLSLVARTDGPVILLLDEVPDRVLEARHDHPRVRAMLEAVAAASASLRPDPADAVRRAARRSGRSSR